MAPSEGNIHLTNLGGLPMTPITPTTPSRFPGPHVPIGAPIDSNNELNTTTATFVRNMSAQTTQPRIEPQRPFPTHANPCHQPAHVFVGPRGPERPSERYLKQQLSTAQSENAELYNEIARLQAEIQKRNNIIHGKQKSLDEAQRKMDDWKCEHTMVLEKNSEDLSSLRKKLQNEAVALENRLSAKIKELEKRETKLKDLLDNQSVCTRNARAEKAILAEELASKDKQFDTERIARLACEAELNQMKDKESTLVADLATERSANADLQTAADQAEVERDDAVAQVIQAKTDLGEEKEAGEERLMTAELKRQREQAQVEKLSARLKTLIPDVERRKKQIGQVQRQNQLLRLQVRGHDTVAKKSREELKVEESRLAECVKERDKVLARAAELHEQHQDERERSERLSKELAAEQAWVARLSKDITALQQKIEESEKSLTACRKELETEREHSQVLQGQLDALHGDLEASRKAERVLQLTFEKKEATFCEAQAWIAALHAKFNTAPATTGSESAPGNSEGATESTNDTAASLAVDKPQSHPSLLPSQRPGSPISPNRPEANIPTAWPYMEDPDAEVWTGPRIKLVIPQKRQATGSLGSSSSKRRALDKDKPL